MNEVFNTINEIILNENGRAINLTDLMTESKLDSFGITMLFIELDDMYNIFKDIPEEQDPFTSIDYKNLTMQELVGLCISTSTST